MDLVLAIHSFIPKEYVEKHRPSSLAKLANSMHNMIIAVGSILVCFTY
jgi:hypothetical protein